MFLQKKKKKRAKVSKINKKQIKSKFNNLFLHNMFHDATLVIFYHLFFYYLLQFSILFIIFFNPCIISA